MIVVVASWVVTLAFVAVALRAHRRLVLVARATHELRGPLFAMQLGLHGLGGEPARVAALELELRRAARALEDLAAAPAGLPSRSSREPVDLVGLVEALTPVWQTLASGYGASLRVEPPLVAGGGAASGAAVLAAGAPRPGVTTTGPLAAETPAALVHADPLRLAQACTNLVANAAEHGGGEVRVRVRGAGGRVRIEVADDGPGLPMSITALTVAARGRRGRRGHGLAIAAAIAEHHGGRLRSAPSPTGARLLLDLPAVVERVVA